MAYTSTEQKSNDVNRSFEFKEETRVGRLEEIAHVVATCVVSNLIQR